jgi:ubiquitin thioesterase OTU1
MVAIRLRHPGGVASIQVPIDQEGYTVQDLQQEINKATNILPSRQNRQ